MSKVLNVGGGVSADPVVSAVLGAVGKRYLVETGSTDDGKEYEIYSDGWCVQKGRITPTSTKITVSLPIEYRDIKYYVFAIPFDQTTLFAGRFGVGTLTTTSFGIRAVNASEGTISADLEWLAMGYKA